MGKNNEGRNRQRESAEPRHSQIPHKADQDYESRRGPECRRRKAATLCRLPQTAMEHQRRRCVRESS